jgi:hypothetical protein
MSRSTQWLSLIAGIVIFVYGIVKLFEGEHDVIPFILGLLIIAFSLSKIYRNGAKRSSDQGKEL